MRHTAVVSPHLDDAVLSAWLVLNGVERARVISCFAGFPPIGVSGLWDERTGSPSAHAAVATRRAEDVLALGLTGSHAIHLDLLDAQYRVGGPPVEELASLLWPHLKDAEEVWLPAGLGGHVDHIGARRAGLKVTGPAQRTYLYADLPYAGQPAWPADLTGSPRDVAVHGLVWALRRPVPARTWQATLADIGDAVPGDPRVQRLTPDQSRKKWKAVSIYRSQLSSLKCGPRHLLRRRRLFAYEVYWLLGAR